MNTKNDVEVVINGKQYTLCGYESSDYLQRIATHINEKFIDFKKQDGYNRLDVDMRNILLAINLSDDFFKAQKQAEELHLQKEELEKEIFEMKHELVSMQTETEELRKQLKESQEECETASHRIIRLETELEQKEILQESKEMTTGNENNKTSNKRTQSRKKSSSN